MKLFLNSKRRMAIALLFLSAVAVSSCDDNSRERVKPNLVRRLLPGYEYLSKRFAGQPVQSARHCHFAMTPVGGMNTEQLALENFDYHPLADDQAEQELMEQIQRLLPFAGLYLDDWARKGVLLDLSNSEHTEEKHQLIGSEESYTLSGKEDQSLRVLILWDESNAGRAAKLKEKLHKLPGVTFSEIHKQINF